MFIKHNDLFLKGTFAVLWWILWFVLVKESPEEDRFIKRAELDYITNCLGLTAEQHVRCTNYYSLLTGQLSSESGFLITGLKCTVEVHINIITSLGYRCSPFC